MKQKNDNLSYSEVLILKSLQSGKIRYGLEIRSAIQDSFERRFNFSSLYPKLDLLEAKGFIESEESENVLKNRTNYRRRYFRITLKGSQILTKWEASFDAVGIYTLSD